MMTKKVKPLGNRVLIKRSKAQISKGGIILPDSAQEKPIIGEVLNIGEGKCDKEGKKMPLSVKVGDKVLFTSYAGTEVHPDEENEYLILSEDDILAIVS